MMLGFYKGQGHMLCEGKKKNNSYKCNQNEHMSFASRHIGKLITWKPGQGHMLCRRKEEKQQL